jgi:hypothetical protein
LFNLESGNGSSVETLMRVLKALGLADVVEALAPRPQVRPMAVLRSLNEPKRASRRRKIS